MASTNGLAPIHSADVSPTTYRGRMSPLAESELLFVPDLLQCLCWVWKKFTLEAFGNYGVFAKRWRGITTVDVG